MGKGRHLAALSNNNKHQQPVVHANHQRRNQVPAHQSHDHNTRPNRNWLLIAVLHSRNTPTLPPSNHLTQNQGSCNWHPPPQSPHDSPHSRPRRLLTHSSSWSHNLGSHDWTAPASIRRRRHLRSPRICSGRLSRTRPTGSGHHRDASAHSSLQSGCHRLRGHMS